MTAKTPLRKATQRRRCKPKRTNRIAQVIQHLSPGGIETMALDLVNNTRVFGSSCLISLEGERHSALSCWPRLQSFTGQLEFMRKQPGLKPRLIMKLFRVFKENNVDTVHTHHIGPLLYAGIAARLANVKTVIHTEHDGWHLCSLRRRIVQKLALWIVKPVVVADAKMVAKNMEKYLGCTPDHIIYNGINTTRFSPGSKNEARKVLGLPSDKKIVGCAGRLERVKGQDLLIEALCTMPPSIHLAFAGAGSQSAELQKQVAQLGLKNRVHFLGLVEDMPTFYRALDVFCLPSREEGYPLSALEAQACGIPTAVTDVGGARESLCPITGTLLQPGIPQLMARTLAWRCFAQLRGNPRDFVKECGNASLTHSAYARIKGGSRK